MSEAQSRYLEEIAEDCRRVLGPGIEWRSIEAADGPGSVRLRATYRLAGVDWESIGDGETVVAAHAALRARLLVDRVRLGFTTLVMPD